MRIFIDTNVLLSAALFPGGAAACAYEAAVSSPNRPIVSDYVVEELRTVFKRKFPEKLPALDGFLASLSYAVEIVATPSDSCADEMGVRDSADRPIVRAALASNEDVLLTGDRDLLDSGIDSLRIISPREFLES